MPLSDSFWNLTYHTFGIDPLSDDRESRLASLTPRLQSNQGLWAGDMEPYQEFSLGGLLGSSVSGAVGGLAQLGGDIFDTVSDAMDTGNAWMLDLAGRDDLATVLRGRAAWDAPNVVQEWGKDVKESASLLKEQSLAPMESGGGIWEEVRAGGFDLGEEGAGLSPGEAASRLAGFGVDMGVAAAEGLALGPVSGATKAKALFNAIGAGFAAQSLTDTTVNRREKGDGWMAALALGGADAATTYYLEKAGLESAFGNGVAKAINATNLSKSRVVNGALQGIVGLLGEGTTEAAQTFTNVLINELPDAASEEWEQVSERVQARLAAEMPEAFAGGALFGGALGAPIGAISRPYYTPEAKLGARSADALGSDKPISERVNEVLTDTASNLRKVNDDGFLDPVSNEALQDIATSAMSDAEARAEAIAEQIKEQEEITARLQEALTPENVEQVGEVLDAGIQEAVMQRLGAVESLQLMWQQLTTPMEIPGEDGVLVQTPIAEPGEIVAAMMDRAQAEGIEIPEEQLVSGNIDWNGIMAQEAAKTESIVTSKLSSVAGAISRIVEVDPESTVARIASSEQRPLPVVSPPASPVLAAQRVRNLIYSPDLSQLAMRSGVYELGGLSALRDVSKIRNEKITGKQARKMATSSLGKGSLARIPGAQELLTTIERSVDVIQENSKQGVRQTRESFNAWDKATQDLSESIDRLQQMAVVAQAPRLTPEGMNIESINRVARLVTPPRNTPSIAIADAVRAAEVFDPADIESLEIQRQAGERAAPWIKWLTHSVWQLGSPAARAMVETSTLSPDAITNLELGTTLKQHLISVGHGDIAAEIDTATLGQAMKEVGKNITTPWAIERVMREGGTNPNEIKATMAIIDSMARRWTRKNGSTIYEFYDRLGDYTTLVDVLSHNVLAHAYAMTPEQAKFNAIHGMAQDFARGMLSVFTSGRPSVGTISHEMIHLLQMSGMMAEMLDTSELAGFEEWLGHRLVDEDGKPVNLPREYQEKMARGFERFLVESKAPTGIRHLFERIKYWMADIVESLRNPDGVAYDSGEGFVLKWNDIELNQGAIDSFYMLLNAKPDGSDIEYVASAGAPGLARALELQMSKATGLPADGFLTAMSVEPEIGTPDPEMSFREKAGLVNEDAGGEVWDRAVKEMEEERQHRAEWDGVRPAFSAMPPDKEANKAMQNAMALEAPLALESTNYDEQMDVFEKLLINASKDIFNHGKPTHGMPGAVINSLKNFMAGMQKANDIRRQAGLLASARKVGGKLRRDSYTLAESSWKAFERALGNYGASYEGLFRELGMPEVSEYVNNLHSVGKMATNTLYKLPMVMDPESLSWREIPGGERWIDIEIDFAHAVEALWKSRWEASGQKTYKQFFQEMRRDLAVYLVAQRQIELSERAERELDAYELAVEQWEQGKEALGEGVPYVPRPRAPKLPYINPKTTAVSKNAISLLTARYGKDLSILERDSLRRVKWVNHMVLDKLLFYKMITQKAYDDMKAAGARYIPLYKVKDVLESSGITDVMMDASMYDVLKYLKTDATKGVENPLESMVRKAMAAEVLTHRQLGKNALGSAINRNMNFYNTDGKHGVEVLSKIKNVTEEEWLATPEGRRKSQTVKVKKDKMGNPLIGEDGKRVEERTYPIMVNATKDDLDTALNALASHRSEGVSHEAAKQELMKSIVTFYEEPGAPTYLLFTDKDLASSVFHLNNPQAVMASSVIESILSKTSGAMGKILGLAFGYNSIIKNFFVTNPQFQYNAVARDALFAPTRSRHGLNPLDYGRGAREAFYSNLPSLREVDPEKHWLAHDASIGTGMFSGLISGGGRSLADIDMLAYLQTGKKALVEDAKGGNAAAAKKLLAKDLRTFAAREGLVTTPMEIIREVKSGDRNAAHMLLVPWSFLQSTFVSLRMLGNVQENAYRMAERELAAHEEITDQRLLATGIYKTSPEHLVGGKVRAGFTGNRHRKAWANEKALMEADPEYVPAINNMPVQFSAASRDYSANHVTLHFPQKGTRTHDIETVSVFFNPNVQDTYTSLRKIAQHTLVQKALAKWGGRKWEAAANQQRLDAETSRWLLLNTLYLSLPMLTSLAYYSGDDEESRKWQSRTFMEKMSYWHIPFPGLDEPLRIASGIGLASLLFKDLPAAAWMQVSEQDPGAMKKWGKRFLEGTPLGQFFGPAVDFAERGIKGAISGVMSRWSNELVNPAAQMAMNWDTYRDREIQWRTNTDPTETGRHAYGALAAKVAKVFGPDLQPAEAAFLIKSYTPGVLSALPSTIDYLASTTGIAPEDVMASNSPVKSQGASLLPKLTSPTPWGMGNESVQWVMRTARRSDQQLGSWKKMPEGRQPSYLAENPLADAEINSMLDSVRKSIHYGEDQAKSALLVEGQWKNKTTEEREKDAMDIRRLYSMEALEAMREVMGSI